MGDFIVGWRHLDSEERRQRRLPSEDLARGFVMGLKAARNVRSVTVAEVAEDGRRVLMDLSKSAGALESEPKPLGASPVSQAIEPPVRMVLAETRSAGPPVQPSRDRSAAALLWPFGKRPA